jgi:hypothetical protein
MIATSRAGGLPINAARVSVVFLLEAAGERQPGMPARPVDGNGRLRKRRIGESADRDRDRVFPALGRPEDRCAAVRTEAKRPLLAGIREARVLAAPSGDIHSILRPPRLYPEGTTGPTLTGEAVAHRDPKRVAFGHHPELPATARGLAPMHASMVRARTASGKRCQRPRRQPGRVGYRSSGSDSSPARRAQRLDVPLYGGSARSSTEGGMRWPR